MNDTNRNDISLLPSEEKTKSYVEIPEPEEFVYRVWDNIGEAYIKSGTGVRVFLNKTWAQRFCDRANEFAPGRYKLRVFALTEVDEDVLGLFALNK